MARYGYAVFFAVMAGGVAAGVTGVALGALFDDTPGWARALSGLAGLASAAIAFKAIARARPSSRT
jgi:hypothetical protein